MGANTEKMGGGYKIVIYCFEIEPKLKKTIKFHYAHKRYITIAIFMSESW